MPQVGLFFQGLAAGFAGNAINVAVASAIGGAAATGATIGAFLAGPLGSLLLSAGAQALIAGRQRRPRVEDARVNVRLEDAPRWIAGGTCAVGGAAGIFMEYDEDGNFWYAVAHCDGELTGNPTYLLDGIEVTLSDGTDGFTAGDVLTDDFCLTTDGDQYEGTGTRLPIWRIYTVTPSVGNAYGALPAAFTTAFPNLPTDFRGAGVVYSIIRGRALRPENRYKAYRWRGAIGVGEPSVTLVGNFGRMYDPRDLTHDIDDPDTWTAGDGNPAILWAWFRTSDRGKGQPMASVDWSAVADAADICDTTVLDYTSQPIPLYRCGLAFQDFRPRHDCERDILAAMDGFIAYDDQGRAYPVPGYYAAPTLSLTRNRDLYAIETDAVDDGEAPIDGVICEYISPDHGWTRVESAPWVNTDWYDGVSEPRYAKITVEGCQSHNQAVRLAKAFGQRTQPVRRAALEVGIRGVQAIGQRAVDLDVDALFDGPHEIVTAPQEDADGMRFRFAVVPLTSDRWTLGAGEEGEPPQPVPALNIDNTLEAADNVVLASQTILLANGVAGVRILVTFDAPARVDRFFRFRYRADGTSDPWLFFTVDMAQLEAISALVDDGVTYEVETQTVTAGGRATDWAAVATITANAEDDPGALSGVTMTAGLGKVDFTGTTSANVYVQKVQVYRAATGAGFGAAVAVGSPLAVAPSSAFSGTAGDATRTNLFVNPDFSSGWTAETDWSFPGGGIARKVVSAANRSVFQTPSQTAGNVLRVSITVANVGGTGNFRVRSAGTTNGDSALISGNGQLLSTLTVPASPTSLRIVGTLGISGDITAPVAYVQTGSCIAQGAADFYLAPVSVNGTVGTPSGPFALTII